MLEALKVQVLYLLIHYLPFPIIKKQKKSVSISHGLRNNVKDIKEFEKP